MLSDVLYISHTCIEAVHLYKLFVLHAKCTYAYIIIIIIIIFYIFFVPLVVKIPRVKNKR